MSTAPAHPPRGAADPAFARVRDAFAALFDDPHEVGGAVCVTVNGRAVVDLVGGFADGRRTRPWRPDTLVNVFSTSKGLTALCAHQLVDRGLLDLDAPVARYWPEFAQAGKEAVPVRWLLDHSAGLPAVGPVLDPKALYQWDTMTAALAAQEPWWTPGTKHGYHPVTFGWLVGEVIRRVSGQTPGQYLRDHLAGPLGADVHLGTGPEHDARIAQLLPAPPPTTGERNLMTEIFQNLSSVTAKAFTNPLILPQMVNAPEWRRAEIPAANVHATAAGLARIYGAAACETLDGVTVLSEAGQRRAAALQREGPDAVLMGMPTRYGCGFMLGTQDEPLGRPPGRTRAFGHSGAGGSLAFADPDARLGFAYCMNQMQMGMYLIGPRANALVKAVYECV